jgi:hypothetical protein
MDDTNTTGSLNTGDDNSSTQSQGEETNQVDTSNNSERGESQGAGKTPEDAGEEANSSWHEGQPFNQHPEWQKREQKHKQAIEALKAEYEAKLKIGGEEKSSLQTDNQEDPFADNPILKGFKFREFKPQYETAQEYFSDMVQTIADNFPLMIQNYVSDSNSKQEAQKATFANQLQGIYDDLGNDDTSMNEFLDLIEPEFKAAEKEGKIIDIEPYFKAFKTLRGTGEKVTKNSLNKQVAAKIAKPSNTIKTNSMPKRGSSIADVIMASKKQ